MIFNKEDVMLWLPHRDPFLFVDSIKEVIVENCDDPTKTVTPKELINSKVIGHYRTREDHPIFAGHFPGNPILPGVVQVEMMAQVSSFGMSRAYPKAYESNMEVALLGIEGAKFRKPILPEMDLEIRTTCTKIRGSFINHYCEIFHEGKVCSEASVFATVKIN